MSVKKQFYAAAVVVLLCSNALFAQDPVISFDDNVGKWNVSLAEPGINSAEIADNFDDFVEGVGALEVNVALRHYAFVWGTWTDFRQDFATPIDLSGGDEIRFWIKYLDLPTKTRAIQFTCDLFDQPAGASGGELWRYAEDIDFFYNPNPGEWHEVVIPFSRLAIPSWFSPINGVFDPDAVVSFAFGVHGDVTAPDSVRFLIDNLKHTQSNRQEPFVTFDDNQTGAWTVGLAEPIENRASISDNFDDFVEGVGSGDVRVVLNHYAFVWGTWTDFRTNFATPYDLTGATEIRFSLKLLTPSANRKNIIFTADLFDNPQGAAGEELFRWPAQYGLFYTKGTEWFEVVIPFADMKTPSWFSPINGQLDINAITSFAFGLHGVTDTSAVDSIRLLIDNLHASSGEDVATAIDEAPGSPLAGAFRLEQNYPNPFNPTTKINFVLDEGGRTSLKIYNMMGQLVQTVFENANKLPGSYAFDVDMSKHPTGAYAYVLEQGSRKLTRMMTLVK